MLTIGLLVGMPSMAQASIYYPNPSDLNDLDHTKAYAWKIQVGGVDQTGTVTSATLTFNNVYNWNTSANELFLHLFSNVTADQTGPNQHSGSWIGTANPKNVFEFTDSDDSVIANIFAAPTTDGAIPTWIVGNTYLTEFSFPAEGQAPETSTANNSNPGDVMTHQPNGSGSADDTWRRYENGTNGNAGTWTASVGAYANYGNGSKQHYNYTYTFSQAELNILNSYIDDDGWIALGFDPDCHIFNTGIELSLTSSPNVAAVPEPASLLLLGSGLAMARALKKRKKAAPS